MAEGRAVETSPLLSSAIVKHSKTKTHSMCCGDCDAAIAEAAAAVTHVQSVDVLLDFSNATWAVQTRR